MVILGKPSDSWSQNVFQLDKCLMVIKTAVGSVNPLTRHENKVWLRQKHGSGLIVVRSEMKGSDLLSGFSEWKEVASCCMKCTNLWHRLVPSEKSWLSLSVRASDLPHALHVFVLSLCWLYSIWLLNPSELVYKSTENLKVHNLFISSLIRVIYIFRETLPLWPIANLHWVISGNTARQPKVCLPPQTKIKAFTLQLALKVAPLCFLSNHEPLLSHQICLVMLFPWITCAVFQS